MKRILLLGLLIIIFLPVRAQYAPPAGQQGSTAIDADSSVFIDWANGCSLSRGWMNVADTALGRTTYGDSLSAVGKADNGVVSLGDGGSAVLLFEKPVTNGDGWDFAVFENAFTDDFLELAFVEVSSDGENFFRFNPVSLTQTETQVGTFGILNATKIYNLAGKYRALYGTPFDLEELKNEPGLNVNHIVAIKIIDVVGSIETQFAAFDSQGNKINDPWPTAFETGGFDLDAVGLIHNTANTGLENRVVEWQGAIYPNPCGDYLFINGNSESVTFFDVTGKLLKKFTKSNTQSINISGLPKGLLLVKVAGKNGSTKVAKLVRE